ncbi:MAG: hypothetical protein JO270_22835 [Acidobacteriaceae bacterium]|nr:hypothetical protein [Acidobacteriaceae bacterium]
MNGTALSASHPKPNEDCIGCHMARLPAGRGGHTIFTDHRIAIYTQRELAALRAPSLLNGSAPASNDDEPIPWHDPPSQFAQRNLRLAYDIALAAANAGDSKNAIKYLQKTLQLDPFLVAPYQDLARLYAADHQLALAHRTYVRFLKAFPESIEAKRGVGRGAGAVSHP